MRKSFGIGALMALALAGTVILIKPGAPPGRAEALTEATRGISPYELDLRTDTKSLVVQEIADPRVANSGSGRTFYDNNRPPIVLRHSVEAPIWRGPQVKDL